MLVRHNKIRTSGCLKILILGLNESLSPYSALKFIWNFWSRSDRLPECQSFLPNFAKKTLNFFSIFELVSLLNDMQSTIKVFSAQSDLCQSSKDQIGQVCFLIYTFLIYAALLSLKCGTCCTEKYLKYYFPNDRFFELSFKEFWLSLFCFFI